LTFYYINNLPSVTGLPVQLTKISHLPVNLKRLVISSLICHFVWYHCDAALCCIAPNTKREKIDQAKNSMIFEPSKPTGLKKNGDLNRYILGEKQSEIVIYCIDVK
jgi:hypothetical protein